MAGTGRRILVAEDNSVNARLIVAILEKAGHEVTVVGDGAKAVALTRVETFDVILMDVNMPVMDGLTATRQIREGGAPMRDVTIVALTADEDGAAQRECIEAGMNGFLAKPVEIPALLKVVTQAIDPKRKKGRQGF